ncbi:MAG TPA: hypothetical protein VLX28_25770 [Thermoanaerobaculia bacterium]|nr:hypothetical protein [Thermoanaerobaculia bacterium]
MARMTLDLDPQVLETLRQLQSREKKPIGRLASDLLAEALARHGSSTRAPQPFRWRSGDLEARMDLTDKEALYAKLDRET